MRSCPDTDIDPRRGYIFYIFVKSDNILNKDIEKSLK